MRQRLLPSATICAALIAALAACGSTNKSSDSNKKTIVQKQLPQGPFYPTAIEETVADLIKAIGPVDASQVPIAVILKDPSTAAYWSIANAGAVQAVAEIGAPNRVQGVLAADILTSIQALGTTYKAFVFSPYDAGDPNLFAAITATGAKTIFVDSDVSDPNVRDFFFTIDNYAAGTLEATQLVNALNAQSAVKTDPILVFGAFNTSWEAGLQRTQGNTDTLTAAGYTNQIAVNVQFTSVDSNNLIDAIVANPNLIATIGSFGNAYENIDSLKAVEQTSYAPLPSYSFDTEVETLAYMQSGDMLGTIVQRPYFMAYLGVYVAFAENFLTKAQIQTILAAHLNTITGTPVADAPGAYDMGADALLEAQTEALVTFYNVLGVSLQ